MTLRALSHLQAPKPRTAAAALPTSPTMSTPGASSPLAWVAVCSSKSLRGRGLRNRPVYGGCSSLLFTVCALLGAAAAAPVARRLAFSRLPCRAAVVMDLVPVGSVGACLHPALCRAADAGHGAAEDTGGNERATQGGQGSRRFSERQRKATGL